MACEANVWSDMVAALKRFDRGYHATRIENAVSAGFPDVDACLLSIEHAVELKGMRKWPDVPVTRPIRLDHELRDTQRNWLKARWYAGGSCWVVLGIREPEREWMVWEGHIAAKFLGNMSRGDMSQRSVIHTKGDFPAQHFANALLRRLHAIPSIRESQASA